MTSLSVFPPPLEIFSDLLPLFKQGKSKKSPLHKEESGRTLYKLMRQILGKYIYIYIYIYIYVHQIFDVSKFFVIIKACVHNFYSCHWNKTFRKLSKCFLLYHKKAHFVLKFFKLLYFPLALFFPFFVIADFIEEVDWWQILKSMTSLCLLIEF